MLFIYSVEVIEELYTWSEAPCWYPLDCPMHCILSAIPDIRHRSTFVHTPHL